MYALEDRHFHLFPHISLLDNLPFSLKDSPQRKVSGAWRFSTKGSIVPVIMYSVIMWTPILRYPVVNRLLMPLLV